MYIGYLNDSKGAYPWRELSGPDFNPFNPYIPGLKASKDNDARDDQQSDYQHDFIRGDVP